jgi:hypothetical protein
MDLARMDINQHPLNRRQLVSTLIGVVSLPLGFPGTSAFAQATPASVDVYALQFLQVSEVLTGMRPLSARIGKLIWERWTLQQGFTQSLQMLGDIQAWMNETDKLDLTLCPNALMKTQIKQIVCAWYLPTTAQLGAIKSTDCADLARNALAWHASGLTPPGVPKSPVWWQTPNAAVADS